MEMEVRYPAEVLAREKHVQRRALHGGGPLQWSEMSAVQSGKNDGWCLPPHMCGLRSSSIRTENFRPGPRSPETECAIEQYS